MKYKALITDIDGTLIAQSDEHGLPSAKVRKALEKAKTKIHIGVATGRPPIHVATILDHLSLSGPSILLNGAMIIDSRSRDVLYAEEFDKTDFAHVLSLLMKHHIYFTIDEVGSYAIQHTDSYMPHRPLVAFARNLSLEEVQIMQNELSQLEHVTAFQVPDWQDKTKWALHICSKKASKQHAVEKVAEMLTISPQEIIAIGDSYNDLPLFAAAGLKIAMGNAVDQLKAAADYVAPSLADDGVAHIIEKFILEADRNS